MRSDGNGGSICQSANIVRMPMVLQILSIRMFRKVGGFKSLQNFSIQSFDLINESLDLVLQQNFVYLSLARCAIIFMLFVKLKATS